MSSQELASNKNQLPEGYKPTEIGVIPEDWAVVSLQEICRETITYGIVQCGPHIKDGVPYIRVLDMDGPELDVEQMFRTSPSIAARFSRSTVQEGDLVYALRGKLGEVRLIGEAVAGSNLTQGTARLSPKKKIDSNYFLWAMRNSRSIKQAEIEAKGTTFREITLANLRCICIPIPPPEEQKAIAQTLSDVDALIAALDKLIAKKRHIKTATMQQLLTGKTRLPGFGGEWEVKKLGDVVDFSNGKAHENSILPNGKFIVINSKFISTQGEVKKYSDSCFCSVSTDQIVMVMSDVPNGKAIAKCFYIDKEDRYTLNQRICSLKAITVDSKILFYLIDRNPYYLAFDDGVKQTNLRKEDVLSCPLKLPPTLEEQKAIAQFLSDIDSAIAALEKRRAKTQAIKQGMMQQLLTGKTRIINN